jgi:DNA-binding LacI/PurR family transcriptional regulator
MAIGAMAAAQEKGLQVGSDVAVTGFDDIPMAQYLTPPLTTVRQPVWEIGKLAISILFGVLGNTELADTQVLLEPILIVRESSGESIQK